MIVYLNDDKDTFIEWNKEQSSLVIHQLEHGQEACVYLIDEEANEMVMILLDLLTTP